MRYAISRTKQRRVVRRRRKDRRKLSWRRVVDFWESFCLSILLGAGLFVLYIGIAQAIFSPFFNVKEIRWSGLRHLKAAAMTQRFESLVGENLFRMDLGEIQHRLLSDPWIKEVTVKKDFPDHLSIIVVERTPALVEYAGVGPEETVGSPTKTHLLDEEGVVLEQGGSYPTAFPRVIRFSRDRFPEVSALARRLAGRSGVLIDLSNREDLLIHLTEGDGRTQKGVLHLGKGEFESKWERFLEIENDLHQRGLSNWEIDLRFSGKAVVKGGFSPKRIRAKRPSGLPHIS
ncbi:MAG: cell division protein FtsQ/DivIB [Nitrospiria bacterium]